MSSSSWNKTKQKTKTNLEMSIQVKTMELGLLQLVWPKIDQIRMVFAFVLFCLFEIFFWKKIFIQIMMTLAEKNNHEMKQLKNENKTGISNMVYNQTNKQSNNQTGKISVKKFSLSSSSSNCRKFSLTDPRFISRSENCFHHHHHQIY